MTKAGVGTYSLMVSIILWGTLLGGVVYSHLVYFPAYLAALPDSAVVVNGRFGLDESIFWMSIHPITILSLLVSSGLNWRQNRRRKLILIVLAVYIGILGATWIYFVPELTAFKHSPQMTVSAAEWLNRSNRWQHLSWIRGAIMYLCMVPLLFALIDRPDKNA
jgi:uncharacterized membrane protein